MPSPLASIRSKLIFSFAIFLGLTVLIIAANFWYAERTEEISELMSEILDVDHNTQLANKVEKDFFSDETINPKYHRTRESAYLDERRHLTEDVLTTIRTLKNSPLAVTFAIQVPLDSLEMSLTSYDTLFGKVVQHMNRRGFKDFGLEGSMRESIHEVEAVIGEKHRADLLMIRRHEKDFLLRKESQYVDKLQKALKVLITRVQNDPNGEEQVRLLEHYERTFMMLVHEEKIIGFDRDHGLMKDLYAASKVIVDEVTQLNVRVLAKAEHLKKRLRIVLFSIVALTFALSVFLAWYVTRLIGKPIQRLSGSIHSVVSSNFDKNALLVPVMTNDEVGLLSRDFEYMLEKMHDYMLDVKTRQRILEDNLHYAKRIQQGVLPTTEDFGTLFSEHFSIYKPLQTVSGDFYWFAQKGEYFYLGVIDCTGHGVTGAIMSLVAHTLLNRILSMEQEIGPADSLMLLHKGVMRALRQRKSDQMEGLEIGLCRFLKKKDDVELVFAGAKIDCLLWQGKEIEELRADRRQVGGVQQRTLDPFKEYGLTLKKGDALYMMTDGFRDQNNPERLRFGKRRVKKLLTDAGNQKMSNQQGVLEKAFDEHRKGQPARDDITVIGVRV